MMIVTITGGIGSGKSTVADLFAELGVPVSDADLVAREVVQASHPGLQAVVNEFGDGILNPDGTLNRAALREIVFNAPEKRKRLEGILHPLIRTQMQAWAAEQRSPYCLFVIPLLIETGGHERAERILVVDSDEALRRARVGRRDNLTPEQIEAVFQAQATRQARLAVADDVITNNDDLESLKTQVFALHSRYNTMASNKKSE